MMGSYHSGLVRHFGKIFQIGFSLHMDRVNPSLSLNPLWDLIPKLNQPMFVRLVHMDYIPKLKQLCLFVYSMWIKPQT
jgi:hypothetical protein